MIIKGHYTAGKEDDLFSLLTERRQISSSSAHPSLISYQPASHTTYNNSKRILHLGSRQKNARKIHPRGPSASLREGYDKTLLSRLPPLRGILKRHVIRRKLKKSNDRSYSLIKDSDVQIVEESPPKKSAVESIACSFNVFRVDVLCRLCDNLQGEFRSTCRKIRCDGEYPQRKTEENILNFDYGSRLKTIKVPQRG
jgi:hypothetical protein